MTWVHDSRESTYFATEQEAQDVADLYMSGNQNDAAEVRVVQEQTESQ